MPTYEYVCGACEHAFEEFQSITAKPLRKCPDCAKLKLRRLIGTGAGFIFKGSGFYETDYRSDGYKKDQKADTSDSKTKPADTASKKTGDAAKPEPKTKKTDAKPASPSPAPKKPSGTSKPPKKS